MDVSGEMTIGETRSARALMRRVLLGWKRFGLLIYLGLYGMILAAFLKLAPLVPDSLGGRNATLVAFVLSVIAAYWGYLWWVRTSATSAWRRLGQQRVSKVVFSATSDAFTIEGPTTKTSVAWSGVYMVAPDRRYWIFMIPGMAYCVPKRFFDSPNSETQFLTAVWEALPADARTRSTHLQNRLGT
jgi:YcxB-like protein